MAQVLLRTERDFTATAGGGHKVILRAELSGGRKTAAIPLS